VRLLKAGTRGDVTFCGKGTASICFFSDSFPFYLSVILLVCPFVFSLVSSSPLVSTYSHSFVTNLFLFCSSFLFSFRHFILFVLPSAFVSFTHVSSFLICVFVSLFALFSGLFGPLTESRLMRSPCCLCIVPINV
jgi:hypothetical protein